METSKQQNTLAGSVIRVGIAAFLWALFVATMVFFVPRQRRTFDDFQMSLPTLTMIVVDVSMWFADFWWVLIPFAIGGLFVASGITWILRPPTNSRPPAA